MTEHKDGSVTLSKEEYQAFTILSATFYGVLPHLEAVFKMLDAAESKASKVDNPTLFVRERVN